MSRVADYVEERRIEVEDKENREKTLKRVTVRLSGGHYAMLMEVAVALKDTNTGCAEELLGAAIEDAWSAITLRTPEDLARVLKYGV